MYGIIHCMERNELGEIIRDGRIEQFRGGAEPVRRHVEQELAGELQAARDIAAAVQVWVVHEALPAERGARLLEIAPHHELDVVGDAFRELRQLLRVFQRGGHVVDRARPGDDDQALVRPVEDLPQFRAVPVDVLHDVRVRREFGRELFGRFDRLFCLVHGMSFVLVFELFVKSSKKRKPHSGFGARMRLCVLGKKKTGQTFAGPNPSDVMTFACTRANGLRQAVNRQKKP